MKPTRSYKPIHTQDNTGWPTENATNDQQRVFRTNKMRCMLIISTECDPCQHPCAD